MSKAAINLMSKASKGIQPADVANISIRHILSALSADKKITQAGLEETEEFFAWKCPYTGVDLRERINNGREKVVLDHIVPQNRQYCGLNIKGNLIWVDREANTAKGTKSVSEFLLNDTSVLGDTPESVRRERLKKIEQFQKECGYNPDEVRNRIHDALEAIYNDTLDRQIDLVMQMKALLAEKPSDAATTPDPGGNEKTAKIKRNTDKYIWNGVAYNKRRLALCIVEDYIKNHPGLTFHELIQAFPMTLSFDGKPLIRRIETVSQAEKDASRVYWKNPIVLADGETAVVNTQWQKKDMPQFLAHLDRLGYAVVEQV